MTDHERTRHQGALGVLVVLLTLSVILLSHSWMPLIGRLNVIFSVPLLIICSLALLVLGIVWIRSAIHAKRGGCNIFNWAWAGTILSLLVLLIVALFAPWPSFERSESDFDFAARQALADPRPAPLFIPSTTVGPFHISSIIVNFPSETVYFVDDDRSYFSISKGWVYSPKTEPVGMGFAGDHDKFSTKHINGPWYEFTRKGAAD